MTAALSSSETWHLTDADVKYGAVPLFHFSGMLGLLVSPMQAGATGVLDRRFSASQFWDRVRAHGATTVTLVGAMIMMVWNLPR
ncbi:MAG: ATP-dependent acyl-CoA ligase, partial [Actinobacteria bacterium]